MNDDLRLFLAGHPLAMEFILQLEGKQFSDINHYVAEFEKYCKNKVIRGFDNTLWFKIVKEKLALHNAETFTESYEIEEGERIDITLGKFNPNLQLDEYDLESFIQEWEKRKAKQRKFTDEQSPQYKSVRESRVYDVYTYDEKFLEYYKHAAHPLIQSTIGRALIVGGNVRGVGYLFNALTRAVVMPNMYWHTSRALMGYIEAIWEIIRLCQLAKISGEEEGVNEPYIINKLLRLLFLYMSRYVELNPNDIKTVDIYSNRAELFYTFQSKMKILFMDSGFPTAIPNLQFSADKYLAYHTASRVCPQLVNGFYEQCRKDAFKMYRYGNLNYLTEDGGYNLIEDSDFMEIVERYRERSRIVAQRIYDEDSKGRVYLTKKQVEYLFKHLVAELDLPKKNLIDLKE